jgi:hypothetical protein
MTTDLPFAGFATVELKELVSLKLSSALEEEVIRDHEVDVDGDSADLIREALGEVIVELFNRFRPKRACGEDGERCDESHEKRA